MYKKIIILTLMAFLVISFSSSAQDLTVTNVSIADQSVNVDTSVTLTMTFSEELRPFKAGFEFDDVVEIGPDNNIRVTNIRVSGATISADFILQSNTTYQINLSNEFLQAKDGSTLPDILTNVVTFSTGASLDAGSVSGTITPAVDLSEVPAYVGLLQETEDDEIFYRGVKVNSDGTYTIPNAPAGSFIVFAFQDVDGNNSMDDGNYNMSMISLTEGEQKTGVDITIPTFTVTSITPDDGAVNVDTATTITIIFSDTVDYESGDDYRFSCGVFPEPLQQGDITWSRGGTAASFDVVLNDNKIYGVGVFMARSDQDQCLTTSPFYYFTTGSSIPSGSISGKISNPLGSAARCYTVAIDESGNQISAGITDRDGDYVIKHLSAGGYIIAALTMGSIENYFEGDITLNKKAETDYNEYDQNREVFAGYYGWDPAVYATPPTAVTVSSADVPDINITIGQEIKMKLLSTSPAADAVNIATDLSTLSLTFNLPLNKAEAVKNISDYFEYEFGFQMIPLPIGAPDSGPPMPDFSDNGRTLTFDMTKLGMSLTANTMYTIVMREAKDFLGSDSECKKFTFENPSVTKFTTGSAFPANSISGTVSFSTYSSSYYSQQQGQGNQETGQAPVKGAPFIPEYSFVFLFNKNPEFADENDMVGAGLVNLTDGSYGIPVEDGTYYPMAFASAQSSEQDFYGAYNPDNDNTVDSVTVSGSSLSNIDIDVYGYKPSVLTGVVRARQGRALSGGYISIYNNNYAYNASVGYDGRFKIENITPGSYYFCVNFGDDLEDTYSDISMEILIIKDMYLPVDIVEVEDHFTYTNTGINPITVQIKSFAITNTNYGLSKDDEIGILTADGTTVGAVKFDDWQISTPINITVYADDPLTEEKDGYEAGDTIVFKYYRQSIDKEYTAEIPSGTLTFSQLTSPIDLSIAIAGKNQLTVKNVGADSSLQIQFADMTSVNLQFQAGDVANKEIKITAMGTNPDTLTQLKEIAAAGVYVIESDEVANESFQARLTFEYTNTMIAEAGISVKDLTIAFFDDTANVWNGVNTEVDTINKTAYCETSHFSVWALTDENQDNLISSVKEEKQPQKLPTEYLLYQNYPNPFNAETVIRYQIPKSSTISLKIYNTMGQEIAALIDSEPKPAGKYTLRWNGMNKNNVPAASGIYFYTLKADNHSFTRKMVYLK